MPTFRQFPQTIFLLPTDAFVISRLGSGTLYVDANVVLPGLGGFLITANGTLLGVGNTYGVKTGLGAFSGTLPQVSTVKPGSLVILQDVDNNAGVNNFTVNAFSGDQIADHGALSSSYALAISNTLTVIMANATVAPYTSASQWEATSYGM